MGLDTSVMIRVLTGSPSDLAASALAYLEERQLAGDRLLVADLAVAEAYFALQHHYGVSKRDTLEALRSLLGAPGVECTGEAAAMLETPNLESAKPGFVDRIIHAHYLRAGADEIATFEKAAARLPAARVLPA